MYLKRLEMNGFKSFIDAKVEFQSGITAIVGPNGSGKSNILDAILWVLGEQSTKTLRSEKMEDVIFNGTESRKPHGMVEVSLILGDVDGRAGRGDGEAAPLPYSLGECEEVMVTRRLFRDGVSEYFINQTPCRLKDLRSLLLDTRAGSKGHTIIEQGMIDRLLKASPTERRELIEETAGIVRYKKQKAEALRKLEATTQNLLRVRDVVNEVKRQLGSLERQAKAAETYQALRAEVRRLELVVLIHEHHEVSEVLIECRRLLTELEDRETAEQAASAVLSTELERIRLEVTDAEPGIGQSRDQVARIEGSLTQTATAIELLIQRSTFLQEQRARVDADLVQVRGKREEDTAALAALRERAEGLGKDLAARESVFTQQDAVLNEAIQRYRDSQTALEAGRKLMMDQVMSSTAAANRMANGQVRVADLGRRIERLEQERVQAEASRDAASEELSVFVERRRRAESQLRERLSGLGLRSAAVARLQAELSHAQERVSVAQEEMTLVTARQTALQALMRHPALRPSEESEHLGASVAQVLVVSSDYDVAIEAVLGQRLVGTVVETPAEAVRFVERLRTHGVAGGFFLPKHPRSLGRGPSSTLRGRGVIAAARDLVTPRNGYEDLVTHLLAGVLVVRSLQDAMVLWADMTETEQALLVTIDGEIVMPDGTVSGRPVGETVGVIARERELRALADRLQELEHALNEAKAERERVQHTLTEEAAAVETGEVEVRRLEMDLVGQRKDEERGEQELAQWKQRIEVLMAERAAADAERAALAAAEHAAREEAQSLESERVSAERSLATRQATVTANERTVEQQQAVVTEVRLEVAGLSERYEQARVDVTRLETASAAHDRRLGELQAEAARLESSVTATIAERHQTEAGVPAMQAQLDEARRGLAAAQETQMGRTVNLRRLEMDLNRSRQGLEQLRREQEALRLRQREGEIRLEGFEGQLRGTYAATVESALAEVGALESHDLVAVRERLAQKRGRLQDLGPVNVMAIDEHRELEERLRFLTTQEQDLAQSVASLKAIIAKINRTTKQLFLDTFQELQTKFDEMFRIFFEGGRAELVLVEEEEDAEPGIDIVAQPPGKRLKNISMLSGGERALTAMALIFASFMIRPTPFCVLDEIDAPLDDENTARFTRVLQGMAARCQFIIITHAKHTMEVADSLYGVTMEEPGISALVSVRLNRQLEPA
jgi:chromosome segregation protein